jgi:hypothetical protein
VFGGRIGYPNKDTASTILPVPTCLSVSEPRSPDLSPLQQAVQMALNCLSYTGNKLSLRCFESSSGAGTGFATYARRSTQIVYIIIVPQAFARSRSCTTAPLSLHHMQIASISQRRLRRHDLVSLCKGQAFV